MAGQFPKEFGKYKNIEGVGRGGFADVYKAVDTTLDRTVALKFLEPRLLREPAFVERFQHEAKLVANLKHPNIVFVHEFGWKAGTVYIAMEFLEGRTLKEVVIEEGALPPRRIVNMVGQIASALDYAHGRGLVHRDIKPSNIMVGADDHMTMMDFGIAKAAAFTALTTTGRIFGTPEYMSPEQAEGVEELDARSDVYSLGVVVYEMFTGQVPFSGTTPLSILRGHADKPPPQPSKINPAVSPAVEAVLLKALAKKREERYQSAGEMAAALKQAVSEVVDGRTPWLAPVAVAVGGICVVMIVLGIVFALVIGELERGGEPTAMPTSTPEAAALAPTATPTTTPAHTPTPVPPISTPLPPMPTDTPVPPTDTLVPPTDTPPPTAIPVPPTDTPPPTAIPVPPTDTPPPTATPVPPTDTPFPTPTVSPDTDGDGLRDSEEQSLGTDPMKPDTDGDGLSDGDEVGIHGTDPNNWDTDRDRIPDEYELELGTDPKNPPNCQPRLGDGEEYVVQTGDSLGKLAEKYLGNPYAAPAIIYYTNLKGTEDPTYGITRVSSLAPGYKLYIPSTERAEAYFDCQ